MNDHLKTLSVFTFMFLVLMFAQSANAATTVTPAVDGLSGGSWKPLTTPSIAGSNFTATGKVLINGRFVNIPGYIPPASTAANAAKTAAFNNPWILGAMLLGWIGDAGLGSDQTGWVFTPPPDETSDPNYEYMVNASGNTTGWQSSPMNACTSYLALTGCGTCTITGAYGGTCYMTNTEPGGVTNFAWTTYVSQQRAVCPSGSHGTPPNCVVTVTTRPATLADFEALPEPPIEALAELAPQVAIPVDAPVFEPGDYEIGNPYTRADGSTAQPMAKVSPAGNGQVTIDTYDLPLTTPTGDPITNPEPEPTPDPLQSQCDLYPHTLGCANLDVHPSENLQSETRSVAAITPVEIGGAGQCPAPLVASFLGQTVEFTFSPLCTFATTLRPLLLALAWLSAGIIFIGGVRNG